LVEIFKSAVFDWVSGGSIAHLDTNVDQLVEREREREREREKFVLLFFVVGDQIGGVFGTGNCSQS